jgi:Mg-chelatase subunit ChlI
MPRAARALAALKGKSKAGEEDILAAARFVLPHRMSFSIFHNSDESFQKLEEIITGIRGKKKLF